MLDFASLKGAWPLSYLLRVWKTSEREIGRERERERAKKVFSICQVSIVCHKIVGLRMVPGTKEPKVNKGFKNIFGFNLKTNSATRLPANLAPNIFWATEFYIFKKFKLTLFQPIFPLIVIRWQAIKLKFRFKCNWDSNPGFRDCRSTSPQSCALL